MKYSKRMGQHFLSEDILRKEVEFAHLSKKDVVLEIGAGDGRLTELLMEKAGKVIAIEKDAKLIEVLEAKLSGNVKLICADAMKIDFPKFNKIVSNIPYYLSSPLTFKFFSYKWDEAIITYQKEFAQRFFAKPCDKNYSRLTVAVNYFCTPEKLMTVPKSKFTPHPKVDSIMVRFTLKKNLVIDDFFLHITSKLFQHKRKLVRSALKNAKFSKKQIDKIPEHLQEKRVVCCSMNELKQIAETLKQL